MSVRATYNGGLTVREVITTDVEAAESPTIINDQFNRNTTLSATTTPAVTKSINRTLAMTSGALTIDLTSLVGAGGVAVDFTGLKVRCIKVQNPSTHTLSVASGASNGYTVSSGTWKFQAPVGGEGQAYWADGGIAVDSSHKTIDIAGTGSDTVNIQLVAG